MGLSNPANAKPELIRTGQLLEVISQHGRFVGQVPIGVGCLRDGEEDVMLHGHAPIPSTGPWLIMGVAT
jgi:hypothetical protein